MLLSACSLLPNLSAMQGAQTTQNAPVSGDLKPAVIVNNQEIKEGKVTIAEVVSSGPGWLVIHIQQDGGVGDAIGLSPVQSGLNTNVVVKVDPHETTATLYAMLHQDSGVVGKYEYPGPDTPVIANGQMLSPSFQVLTPLGAANQTTATQAPASMSMASPTPTPLANSAAPTVAPSPTSAQPAPGATQPAADLNTPSIEVMDQPIQDGKIIVPQVVSLGNWWLVIHKQNPNGSIGTMVGYRMVHRGLNTNVEVKVDTKSVTPVLYAMLHEDKEEIGVLTFPGPDAPVMVNDQMLEPSFNILTVNEGDVVINSSQNASYGPYLVNSQGLSLYISLGDTANKSNCSSDCLKTWRPLLATGKLVAGPGVSAGKFGVILLADGSRQVTYQGAPLYTYTVDSQPGDVSGQGVDGLWYLATP
jgi:predicted lipoprotein with Yx(FWY)xxD motif